MIISAKDLTVKYRSGAGTFTVLDIPSWEVDDGEQALITGPSGSGKSTLLNVIAGLMPLSTGSLLVCGRELNGMGEFERDRFRAENISYIFQTFNLLQGYTALENVLIGATFSSCRIKRSAAMSLLEQVGLGHRMHHYPARLSIGEQQRVSIARALAKKPRLILADEPTGSLDPAHSGGVITMLQEACREHSCALVVVSHETALTKVFQRRDEFMALNKAFAAFKGGEA